jgi:hypothetical protein
MTKRRSRRKVINFSVKSGRPKLIELCLELVYRYAVCMLGEYVARDVTIIIK